jgi:predicted AAA+ superfamily ATPase
LRIKKKRNFVSLDTLEEQESAKRDPRRFLERYQAPLLLDEIQYAPELLSHIKAIVDKKKKKGMYWIIGSQQFNLIANIAESLAGRVGILNLQGFSQVEKDNISDSVPFLPTKKNLAKKEKINKGTKGIFQT